ncbi:SidE phosphodiesterase domain-containing protein [Legionella cincinnatiensis]|uniref:SidE PDE domain-containing protein n=1 Tax=Legionella cincinnatiensis TaxID=28085 RepID=A0A378IPN3_9GAMM|nr:SidE phosphodiesterase domain-containing protein [Legionella cincinnatiensis]KTC93404.1 hypothetical protein Lcin_0442 [Legionella cincinnatiensis]STX36595.1 Uncharacterised protein [Legionella cincinnatiensis]
MNFSSSIEEIAEYIGEKVYLRGFPIVEADGAQLLDRDRIMPNSPDRVTHGFDNANRSAALLPYIIDILNRNQTELPEHLQKQLAELTPEHIKALQIVALMRASGRHYHPNITPHYWNNPDYGSGSLYAKYGEQECLAMLKELNVPAALDHQKLAFAVLGNEFVTSLHANSSDERAKNVHHKGKDDLYSLLINVLNVLETTRDRKDKVVQLEWMPLFNQLGKNGQKEFIDLAKTHIESIRELQEFLWTTTKVGDQIIAAPDMVKGKSYNGKKCTAQKMFDLMTDAHGNRAKIEKNTQNSLESARVAVQYWKDTLNEESKNNKDDSSPQNSIR